MAIISSPLLANYDKREKMGEAKSCKLFIDNKWQSTLNLSNCDPVGQAIRLFPFRESTADPRKVELGDHNLNFPLFSIRIIP